MKTIAATVLQLQKKGVSLFREGDDIRYRTASGAPPAVILQELSRRRDELVLYWQARDSMVFPPLGHSGEPAQPSVTQEMWWRWIDRDTSLTLSLMEFVRGSSTEALVETIKGLVMRHETLRARFSEENGVLKVAFNAAADFKVETETLPSSATVESLKGLVDAFIARPLTAAADWLARAKVFCVPHKGHVAVIVANHMVVDGTSIDILRAELRRPEKVPVPGGGETLSYADFAAWQRTCLDRSGQALAAYWSAWSRSQPEILSPAGKIPMRWRPGTKVRRTFTIPRFAHSALIEFASENATFPFMVYLTLLALAVARWSGQSRFPLRSICDSRTVPALSSVVGLMTGADAIGISWNANHSFTDNLKEVEAEYHAAGRLRLPNIYAFPPFAMDAHDNDQRHNIAVIMNHRKTASHVGEIFLPPESWPPPEGVPRREIWRHPVSPICLELTQLGEMATAAFLMHEDILTAAEQDGFIQTFFNVFEETVLRGNEAAKELAPHAETVLKE